VDKQAWLGAGNLGRSAADGAAGGGGALGRADHEVPTDGEEEGQVMPDFKLISIVVDAGDPERYIAVSRVRCEPSADGARPFDLHLRGAD